jgi:hypothetical protein
MRPKAVLVLWATASCGPDASRIAAKVGDHELSSERLAELMVLAQPVPLTTEVAEELADHWVRLMVFAERMARGDSMLDSVTIREVMWLPVRAEMVRQWRDRLLERAGVGADDGSVARFDSTHGVELLRARGVRLRQGATATVREIAADPWRWRPGSPLAAFSGGSVAADAVARHLQYLSTATRREITAATDQRIVEFVLGLVVQEILVAQAESAGVQPSDSAMRVIAGQSRDAVHRLWNVTGLAPSSLLAEGSSESERRRLAARRVGAYLDAAAARRLPLEPVPAFLAVPLLRRAQWAIVPAGVEAAVHQARRLVSAAGQ